MFNYTYTLHHTSYYICIKVVLQEAVPEVSKRRDVNQERNVPIEFDCDLSNTSHSMSTSHSISQATLFFDLFC